MMMREDWIEVKLGEILNIERGGSPRPIKDFITNEENGINWIKIGDTKNVSKYIYSTAEKIKPEGLKKTRIVNEGDFLLSNSMSFGRPYIMKTNGAIHDGWLVLKDKENFKIEVDYLYHVLSSPYVFTQFDKFATGSTVKNLNTDLVSKVQIPLAPLPEQRAIAAKIEQLFSELDNGIANLKAAKSKLEIYRQAVFKKMLDGIELVSFEEIIKASQNGISKRQGINGKETKVLRLADISNLKINYESPRYILLDDAEIEKYKINKNDLLVIRVNGSKDLVGRLISFTQKDELEAWAFCDHFIRLSLDHDKFNSKFYFYFFQMPETRKYIHDNMVSSAGQNTVSQVTIKSVKVPYLDKASQNQIVQEIETRLSVCDKLNESIDQSLEKAQALRQSILKKAFEGKLFTQDELQTCRQQPDWEPAAKLLERVKKDSKNKR